MNTITTEQLKTKANELLSLANKIKTLSNDIQSSCKAINNTNIIQEEFNNDEYLRSYIKDFCIAMGIDSPKMYLDNVLFYKSFVMYTKFNTPKVQEISYYDFKRLATSYM